MPNGITLQDYLTPEEKARQETKQTNQAAADKSLTSLGEYKDSTLAMYSKNQNQAQQGAYVGNEMLKKYLPQQQNAAGLGGLGVSQTAQLQANNNHMSAVGQINANYDNMRAITLQDYATKKAGVEDTLFNRNAVADDIYKQEVLAAHQVGYQRGDDDMRRYMTAAEEDGVFDESEYNDILAKMEPSWSTMSESDSTYLKRLLKSVYEAKARANAGNHISYNGRGYSIQNPNEGFSTFDEIMANETPKYEAKSFSTPTKKAIKKVAKESDVKKALAEVANGTAKNGDVYEFSENKYVVYNGKFYLLK